jgi:hypothetical protein
MMVFRIFCIFTFLTFLFSCAEKDEPKVPTPAVAKRRLFEIKRVEKKIPINNFMYYKWRNVHFFEVTLKNVSSYDFDLYFIKDYYHNGDSHFAPTCIQYFNHRGTGECMFWADTSCLIKKNEEFVVYIPLRQYDAWFDKYEFQGIEFRLFISCSNDLSFYFEDNPNKPIIKISEGNDHVKKYAYPFEFTYWVTNDVFWEDHLLEHLPFMYRNIHENK